MNAPENARVSRPVRFRVSAAVMLWAFRLACGALVALAVAFAVEASGATAIGTEDALFESGSLLLLETLRVAGPSLFAALKSSLIVLGVLGTLGLVPLAAALHSLGHSGRPDWEAAFARALRVFPRFVWLSASVLAAQALVFALVLFAASLLNAGSPLAEGSVLLSNVVLALVGAALALELGAALDLGRALVVHSQHSTGEALRRAARTLRSRQLSVLAGLVPSVAGALLLVLVGAYISSQIDGAHGSALKTCALFAVHQVVVLGCVCLRLIWLGRAVALVADAPALGRTRTPAPVPAQAP